MSHDTPARETAAKWGFVAVMAVLLGGAGIVIAALAVGIEKAFNGRFTGPAGPGPGGGMAGHVQRQREWLAADRAYRRERGAAHRAWWQAGADPNKRPTKAKGRLRRALRNAYAGFLVGTAATLGAGRRFSGGAREAWERAARRRREGGTFTEIVDAGISPVADDRQPYRGDDGGFDSPPAPQPPEPPRPRRPPSRNAGRAPVPASQPAAVAVAPTPAAAPPPPVVVVVPVSDGRPAPAVATVDNRDIVDAQVVPDPDPAGVDPAPPTDHPAPANPPTPPAQIEAAPATEETVTTPTTPATTAETNLDRTVVDLSNINRELDGISDLTDQLAAAKSRLDGHVAAASERAAVTGAPAATMQALDSASAVSAQLGTAVGTVSSAAVEAGDQTSAAHQGLLPAVDAQDTLHSAGARGEFVSAATE